MSPRHLIPQALTDAASAPYGRALQVLADGHGGHAINEGTAQRFERVADGLLALDAGDYLVLERRGDALDCDLTKLAPPVRLSRPG